MNNSAKPVLECLESRLMLDATIWVIEGLNQGTQYSDANPGGIPFATADLFGGSEDDVYVFANDTAAISGGIDGQGGNDVLHYGPYVNPAYGINTTGYTGAVDVDYGMGVASGVSSFLNIEGAVGGSNANTLIGPDSGALWNITGFNSGTLADDFAFENFGNLTGGTGADEFVFDVAGAMNGSLVAGEGNDVLDLSALSSDLDWMILFNNAGIVTNGLTLGLGFSSVEHLFGGQGRDEFILVDGVMIDGTVNGGDGADVINAAAYTTDLGWNVTGPDAGTINGGGSFVSVETLYGGEADDTFTFTISGLQLSGEINGGDGNDTIDYAGYGVVDEVTVNRQAGTATGIGGFNGMERVVGGSGVDTLIGLDAPAVWNVTVNDAGNVDGTFLFESFGNLTGGSDNDEFHLSDGAAVSGVIDGNAGEDTLNLKTYTTDVYITYDNAAAGDGKAEVGVPNPHTRVINFQSIQDVQKNDPALLGQFGFVGGRRNVSLTIRDGNGTPVTFSLRGNGTGIITGGTNYTLIRLTGTNASSILMVTTPRGTTTTLYDITVDGSLSGILAQTSNLAGVITVNGTLRQINMLDTSAGAAVNVLNGSTPVASMTFNRVQNLRMNLAGGLQRFTSVEWLDTDALKDTLNAAWVGAIITTGARDNVRTPADESSAGHFQADLNLTGLGATRYTLTSTSIAGDLIHTHWSVVGQVYTVYAKGVVDGWKLDGGAGRLTNLLSLRLGDVQSADVTAAGHLSSAVATRWLDGKIDAQSVGALQILGLRAGRTTPAIAGDFQATVTLSGSANPRLMTVTSAYIAGDLNNSRWNVTGKIYAFQVLGTALNSRVQTTDDVRSLILGASNGSDFLAGVNKAFANRFSANRGDFVNGNAKIWTVTMTGLRGVAAATRFVADTHFTAGKFGGVNLLNADFGSVGIHVLGGEGNIQYIRHTDIGNRANTWLWRPGRVPANFPATPLISAIP